MHRAFTPRLVERLRERIQDLAERLLDDADRAGRLELLADYALPLTITVIADLLGVPAHDHDPLPALVECHGGGPLPARLPAGPAGHLPALTAYLRGAIERRRAGAPGRPAPALVQAEEAGDRLSTDELLAMAALLLIAGHETTVNLIAGGTLALLQHPQQTERLRREPALLPSAVEELLRFTGPVELATERYARDPDDRRDDRPRRRPGAGALASANRDHAHFDRPDELDLGGAQPAPGLRAGGALLPGGAPGPSGGADRLRDAAAPPARPAPGGAGVPPALAPRAVLRGLRALPLTG